MNGVEILSSETIYNTILPDWCSALALVVVIICFFMILVCAINEHYIITLICTVLLIGAILVGVFGSGYNKNSISHIEHKVTIDDSVSMNEFLDKYEILDQEGKIYTVKERE